MGAPGCDDAPVVEILPTTAHPKRVTFIYPYYENPNFLARQLDGWLSYPSDLLEQVSIIVVDDGSPQPAVLKSYNDLNLKLFRIEVDVRWNWLAARNIGAHHAITDWLLLTDMDHVVPQETLRALAFGHHDSNTIYRFSRREHDGRPVHPHPNSWFMTREMFWRVGGYDEALSGFYGSDGDYRRRCVKVAPIRILTDILVRHEYDDDSSTKRYKRKQPEDAARKKLARLRGKNWKPRTLSFPYHEVQL